MSGEKSTFECAVSADLFRRALLGISTEETRYYLNGVHVSRADGGGATLVATNGSFLIAIRDPSGVVKGSGIVSLNKAMVAALKTPRGSAQPRLLVARGTPKGSDQRALVADIESVDEAYAEARKLLDAPDGRVQATQHGDVLIDGQFPAWRRVIPAAPNPALAVPPVNVQYLALAADALSTSKHSRHMHLTASGPNEPILVTSAEGLRLDAFAIVMPIRTETTAGAVPAWATPPVAEAA